MSLVWTPGFTVLQFCNSSLTVVCMVRSYNMQCVIPMVLATPLSADVGVVPTFWTPDGITFTRAAVATIGVKRLTRGYLGHALQVILLHSGTCMHTHWHTHVIVFVHTCLQGIFLDNAPTFMVDWMFITGMKQLRAAGLKQQQKAKEE